MKFTITDLAYGVLLAVIVWSIGWILYTPTIKLATQLGFL